EELRPRALVALEGELHVGGRDRLAVVELHALADDELVREPVLRRRPRLREARRVLPGRHGLHQRVVQRVEHHERRDDALGLGGVEPAGGQRDVHAPGHGALRGGGRGAGDTEQEDERDEQDDGARHGWPHGFPPMGRGTLAGFPSSPPSGRVECRDSTTMTAYGSDLVVDLLRAVGVEHVALNPGATFRGLHDSLVNYGGGRAPELVLTTHEEIAVALAHGYAKAKGAPMAAVVHDIVGLQHASMAIFNAFCDRAPILVLGGGGPMDATRRRPWIDWIHTALVQGNQVRDYVKLDDQPASVSAIPEGLLRAWRVARTEPQGPVYVCLDAGLQEQALDAPIRVPDAARF